MRVLLAGGSGFIGRALDTHLRDRGHEVVRLVRREPRGDDEITWHPEAGYLDRGRLPEVDAAVNLAGAGVGDRRWTGWYKELIRSSRVESTGLMAEVMAEASPRPRVLINASAVGFYGDTGERPVNEKEPAGTGFFPEVCTAWEAATRPAEQAGVRVVRLRTGLVLGPDGGLLKPLLPLFRLGLGGRLGSGRQWMPCISLADVLGAIEFMLTADGMAGSVNLTGPEPVRNTEFTRTLGQLLHRPAVLPVPAPALRIALGEFAGDSLASLRVVPEALLAAGYRFIHPDLESALRWAVHTDADQPQSA